MYIRTCANADWPTEWSFGHERRDGWLGCSFYTSTMESFEFFFLFFFPPFEHSRWCLVPCLGHWSFLRLSREISPVFCFPGCCAFRFCLLSSSPRRHDCSRDRSSDAGLSIYPRGFQPRAALKRAEESTLANRAISSVSGHSANIYIYIYFFFLEIRTTFRESLWFFFNVSSENFRFQSFSWIVPSLPRTRWRLLKDNRQYRAPRIFHNVQSQKFRDFSIFGV